jgi:hypothetical protein
MSSFETLCFFRGVPAKYPTDRAFVRKPRKDRRPKDSSTNFHVIADAWFLERFGVRFRSHGVFVTASAFIAQAYAASPAHLVRVVPLTRYRFCWSPSVSDLLFTAKELAHASAPEIVRRLEGAQYQDVDLASAHASGHEVMLSCDEYVSIPVGLLASHAEIEHSKIVLPGS